jgi:hypothetical protein
MKTSREFLAFAPENARENSVIAKLVFRLPAQKIPIPN